MLLLSFSYPKFLEKMEPFSKTSNDIISLLLKIISIKSPSIFWFLSSTVELLKSVIFSFLLSNLPFVEVII